ncbi:putative glycosyl hydrolase [Candidatus Sulfotelmatomonas gaucii]|uniref:Putative glycosyl hydrolase n=1 Tax=Candidatus Sulfuritelmatomonas gaucii TaxID=2043161 RepID=A0A2N9LX53_9BACT|nr:putative glycosyl hydrolase [Candidatus Sulfotelmatomonas gaucii]
MNLRHVLLVAAGLLLSLDGSAFAQGSFPAPPALKPFPFVSPLFGDDMVLQRGKVDSIWGWSDPGDRVRVQVGNKTASGVADADHRWQVQIRPPKTGGPYTVRIIGHQTVELHNVMVGDVWLCTGQSNMLVPLGGALNGADEVKAANYPDIRFFDLFGHSAYNHTGWIAGSWKVVLPETAARVSAVAYYFAREVQKDVHIPIGLIVDAVGGTPAEAWTSAAALRPLKDFDVPLDLVDRLAGEGAPEYGNYIQHWYDQYDIGLKGNWAAPDFDDSTWKPVTLPGGFAELGVPDTPALAWFRKEIDLPDPLPAGRAMMFLGIIERMDTVWVNGQEAGGSAWVENPRVYFMRPGVLKPGRNIIAIRIMKTKPDGGFMSKPEGLHLVLGDNSNIPLAGAWKGQLSVDARPPHLLPIGYQNWPVMPTVLYEGMLKPVAPLSIAGVLWYQGEENSTRAYEYRKVLPAMIADWRNLFGQGNFPFYIVSLPRFKQRSATPVDGDEWAETRESQAITAASVPNSCLAVTIDTGDPDDIHAKDKLPVGQRLAYCALAKHYGKHVVYSGPTLKSVDRLPSSIRVHFVHTDGGLVVRGDKLREFSVAGEDRKWYWADARIDGNTVVVSSPSVPHPKEARYAWQSNPEATLFNGAGLPAAPLRTDTWPGITQNVRPY